MLDKNISYKLFRHGKHSYHNFKKVIAGNVWEYIVPANMDLVISGELAQKAFKRVEDRAGANV